MKAYLLAELSNRERLLICLLSTVLNPQWSDKPWEKQYEVFRQMQAIHAPGKFSDDDLNDLVLAIQEIYKDVASRAGYLVNTK